MSKLETKKYTRKPFPVEAIQVSDGNIEKVAAWCGGKIETTDSKIAEGLGREPEVWIKIKVTQPASDRQTKAFVGDWVLFAQGGFKIYLDKSFRRTFDELAEKKAPVPAPPVEKPSVVANKTVEVTE